MLLGLVRCACRESEIIFLLSFFRLSKSSKYSSGKNGGNLKGGRGGGGGGEEGEEGEEGGGEGRGGKRGGEEGEGRGERGGEREGGGLELWRMRGCEMWWVVGFGTVGCTVQMWGT